MAKTVRKTRKRPCSICRIWFLPDRRVGTRQYVCSLPDCQRERHRRNCTAWRVANPDCSISTERLRQRVVLETRNSNTYEPMQQVDWDVVRDETSIEQAVITETIGKVLTAWVRDEIDTQVVELKEEIARVLPKLSRDEMIV